MKTVWAMLDEMAALEADVRQWWENRHTKEGRLRYRAAYSTFVDLSVAAGGGWTPYVWTTQASSAKTAHNADVTNEVEQIVQYMLPHRLSGLLNLCPWSTPQCRATCLHTSGRLGLLPANIAKQVRVQFMVEHPLDYMIVLLGEADKHAVRVDKCGKQLLVRFNGTGDMPIERLGFLFDLLATANVATPPRWFDYTKGILTAAKRRRVASPRADYYTVASGTERTTPEVAAEYDANIVFVVDIGKDGALPATFWGRDVVDGDRHDMRPFDRQDGVAVLVRSKGDARGVVGADNGFVKAGRELVSA